MGLTIAVFLIAFVSGVAAYRLGRSRSFGRGASPGLVRLATVLAYAWLALSALLFAWAAWRMTR